MTYNASINFLTGLRSAGGVYIIVNCDVFHITVFSLKSCENRFTDQRIELEPKLCLIIP